MEDIFENAKFGDMYVTDNGWKLLFVGFDRMPGTDLPDEYPFFVMEGDSEPLFAFCDGQLSKFSYRIVGKYKEPIDEKKTMKCLTVGQLKEVLKDLDEHYIVQLSIGEKYANLTHIFVNTDYGSVELTDYNVDDEK